MYWPDTQTGVDIEPARKPVASAVRKFFSEGGAGQPPTVPGGDWFNQVTNELLNVLAAAGIDPSKADDDQLLQAINKLMIEQVVVADLDALRLYEGNLSVVSVRSVQDTYYLDASDHTSDDSGGTIIVGVNGARWKLASSAIDVTKWNVISDGVSDASVILPFVQHIGESAVVKLPAQPGTPNVYYFSTFDPFVLAGVTFDVDDGVSISLPSDAVVGSPYSSGIKFSAGTKIIFRSLSGSKYEASPAVFRPLSFKDADISKAEVVPINFLTPKKIAWPSADVFEVDAFAFSDETSALFQYNPGDGKFHMGLIRPRVGDLYSMAIPVGGGALPGIMVVDQGGYSGVYFSDSDASTCTLYRKNTGSPGTSSLLTYPMQGNHLSYSGNKSELQLRIDSASSYSILINGFVVASPKTQGIIEEIGFGGFFPASAGTFAANILYPVVVRHAQDVKGRFTAVAFFGDSRSSPRMECWPDRLTQALDLSCGNRAWHLNNHAVAGHTSAQQLAIMQDVGVADANVVVISVGTNDAQGQVGVPLYRSNLEAMCDICIAAGKPFIVIKPLLWYTQAQSGGTGQSSANYELTAQYRAICQWVCASKGGKLLDLDADVGPIVSYYVNTSAAIDMVGKGDPVVFDNIHMTTKVNDIIAVAVSKAVFGIMSPDIFGGYRTEGGNAIALNGWLINTSDNPLKISASSDGSVALTGRVFKSTGTTTDGTSFAKVAQILAPRVAMEAWVEGDISRCRVFIDVDGIIKIYDLGANNYVSFSGLSWII